MGFDIDINIEVRRMNRKFKPFSARPLLLDRVQHETGGPAGAPGGVGRRQ